MPSGRGFRSRGLNFFTAPLGNAIGRSTPWFPCSTRLNGYVMILLTAAFKASMASVALMALCDKSTSSKLQL